MSDEEGKYDIAETDSGASLTHNVEASSVRKGGYIMVKGKACKVRDVSTSKTGKHGHAKCKFSAIDIFTGATCEELCPGSHNIEVPFVTKIDYTVMGMEEDHPQLMTEGGDMREDLPTPTVQGYSQSDDSDVSNRLREYVEEMEGGADIEIIVTVMGAIGKEKIVDVRKKEA